MLYELLTRIDKNVHVKLKIRNERTLLTIQGSCDYVYKRLNRNGMASNVFYIDVEEEELIVEAMQ